MSKKKQEIGHEVSSQISTTFLLQDSLINEIDSIKRIVYTGYIKKNNDSHLNDYVIIHHLRDNIIILRDSFALARQEYEGRVLLRDRSFISQETIDKYSFIIETSISNRGNFSENIFSFDSIQNRYKYIKRINFKEVEKKINCYFQDTLGLETTFFIANSYNMDSLEMSRIFQKEEEIAYDDSVFSNSRWILIDHHHEVKENE